MGLRLRVRNMPLNSVHRAASKVTYEADGPLGINQLHDGPRRIAPHSDDQGQLHGIFADTCKDRGKRRPGGRSQLHRQLAAQRCKAGFGLLRHRHDGSIHSSARTGRLANEIAALTPATVSYPLQTVEERRRRLAQA